MVDERQWEFEEESASDCAVWSVYDEHGDRLTAPYIGKADALLIAAAPELLKVLQEIISQSDRIDRDSGGKPYRNPECQMLYDKALAVAAKLKAA